MSVVIEDGESATVDKQNYAAEFSQIEDHTGSGEEDVETEMRCSLGSARCRTSL